MSEPRPIRRRSEGPSRRERAAIDAAAEARRVVGDARRKSEAVAKALANARSALRWLDEAARALDGDAGSRAETAFSLAGHVAGAADKKRALAATIDALEREATNAAAALAAAEGAAAEAQERVAAFRRRSVASVPERP